MSFVKAGKYGFYPCDIETYRKLKVINMALDKAKHEKGIWERWNRKQPQNRVSRAKIRDNTGRIIGYVAPVALPEPPLDPLFFRKVGNGVELMDRDVYNNYRLARYPMPVEEACTPLSMKKDYIDELYNLVK